jgi:hypothetical protein
MLTRSETDGYLYAAHEPGFGPVDFTDGRIPLASEERGAELERQFART